MAVPGLPRAPLPTHPEVLARIRSDRAIPLPFEDCTVPNSGRIVFERMSDFFIQQIVKAHPKGLLHRSCVRFLTGTAAFFMIPIQAIAGVGLGMIRLTGIVFKKYWGKKAMTSLALAFKKSFSIITHKEREVCAAILTARIQAAQRISDSSTTGLAVFREAHLRQAGLALSREPNYIRDAERVRLEAAFAEAAPLEERLRERQPTAYYAPAERLVVLTNIPPLVEGADDLREVNAEVLAQAGNADAELAARNAREAAEHAAAAASLRARGIATPPEFAAARERAAAAHQRAAARRGELVRSRELADLPEADRAVQLALPNLSANVRQRVNWTIQIREMAERRGR